MSERIRRARLADLSHRLPMPGRVPFSQDAAGEPVDTFNPFIIGLLNDGSLVLAEAAPEEPQPLAGVSTSRSGVRQPLAGSEPANL